LIVGERFDLFPRDAAFSADRRAEVNSKRAPDERGNAQLCEILQDLVYQVARSERLFHLAVAPQQLGVMSGDLHWHNYPTYLASRHRINNSGEQPLQYPLLAGFSTPDARHCE
jgi:hypothetical protein